MARLTFRSGQDDENFFKELEEALQPLFENNAVAKLGFYAIKDSDVFKKALGSEYEGGANFQLDLSITDEIEELNESTESLQGFYLSPTDSYSGSIVVKQAIEDNDEISDIQKRFILNAIDEDSTFVHELTHAGHNVLNKMLSEGTSPIEELSPKQDPKYITVVPSGVDPKITELNMRLKEEGAPVEITGGYQREQFPNETTNIIARLGLGRSDSDALIFTENLVDMHTYDTMVPSYIKFDNFKLLNAMRSEQTLARLKDPNYNKQIRTTINPIGSDIGDYKKDPNLPYDEVKNPLREFDPREFKTDPTKNIRGKFGFYPSDSDYLKMLRDNNKKLNNTAKKVLDLLETPANTNEKEIPEKPSWWQKALDALPFKEGGTVKSLDSQMKELKVDK